MSPKQDSSFGFVVIILAGGVLSAGAVLFAGSLFFQRKQNDPFFTTGEYRVFQETLAATNIRRAIAEEFSQAVVNCMSPALSPGQRLTESQVTDSVTAAIERLSSSGENADSQKCKNSRSSHWTFESPCRLAISEAFSKTSGVNLGDIHLCKELIIKIMPPAARTCAQAADFLACLGRSIATNDEVRIEIEKPVGTTP